MQISRVNDSKSAAKRLYDHLSRVYDLLAGSSETRFIHLGLEMMAVDRGETVLEIGSGTGMALQKLLSKVGVSGRINGIDLSLRMLQVAHQRLSQAGFEDQVFLLEGDGAHLPYKDDCFSAVFMSFTLELFDTPEIPLVLVECWRVLKPGGRLGVVSLLKTEYPGWIVRLYEWFHAHFPALVDCRPIETQEMLLEAGFLVEQSQQGSMWGLPVELVIARKNATLFFIKKSVR